jgi:ADP-ribose pyrophosphatase YjhB (NUDIX family)
MNNATNYIRPISLLLVKNQNDCLLVFKAEDTHKKETFYRFLGGGIEFGERSDETLKREIKEEINAEIKNLHLLTILENVFTHDGLDMHELVFVYEADFVDKDFYNKESIDIIDSKSGRKAIWVKKDLLMQSHFYPEGIKEYIK